MKRIATIVAGTLMAILIAGGASTAKLNAQNGSGEIFTVPFAFTVDGHKIQPGTYEVRREASQFLISIQNVETGENQSFSVRPEQRSAIPAKGILVFGRCGDQRQLSEFHIRGTNLYSAAIATRNEKNSELESCGSPDVVTLAAR